MSFFSPSFNYSNGSQKWELSDWPAINDFKLKKIPITVLTCKGHLDQEGKNLQSTKTQLATDNDFFLPQISEKTHSCFAMLSPALENCNKKGLTYTDQTGRFIFQSPRGNQYVFTLYNYDANAILVHAIKDREANTLVEAW